MTVKQLIKQLQKMPPNSRVGVAHNDNYEHDVAGWVNSVCLHNKLEIDSTLIIDKLDREVFDGRPDTWVTLRC